MEKEGIGKVKGKEGKKAEEKKKWLKMEGRRKKEVSKGEEKKREGEKGMVKNGKGRNKKS